MMNTRRIMIISSFIIIVYVLYRNVAPRRSTNESFFDTLQLNKASIHNWLILTSSTQLQHYLTSPQLNLSIICITNTKPSLPSNNKHINIIFLDSQLLAKLPFRSTNINNIAYLLAIKFGARSIYQFESNISLFHSPHQHDIKHFAFRRQRSPFINIYPTFTANFTHTLPGLPTHELINITRDGWSSIRTVDHHQETVQSLIHQQILIAHRQYHPPIAVEPFTFSPFSTDNTLFTYDAFWGLVLFSSKSHIWRSWWVQRLLWDIGGHVSYSSIEHHSNGASSSNNEHHQRKKGEDEDVKVSKLVRYLSEWKSTETSMVKRIEQLMNDLMKEKFCDANEVKVIRAWLADLQSVKYVFPSVKSVKSQQSGSSSSSVRHRRTAVCLTGVIECIEGAWKPTARAIRSHVGGEMDVFMYLSSTEPVVDQLSTISLRTRLVEALQYSNFTVKVLFENIPKLDPPFPPNCTTDASVNQPEHKVPRYYQQLFGLSNCFSLVREYEKKHNIKYDIMVRSRADIEFLRIPETFDRIVPYDINTTLIIPPNRFGSKVDDGFAIGPIEAVEVYMNRYHSFRECLTRDLHPERYLDFYLNYRKVKMIVDPGTVVGHIPHSPKHCH